ncbi:MAG: hypothetical protein QME60_07950 [Verrucomicrobiota bacterium]|nr:hypothetical protein [Verrucomicrobiota bacterium]
MPMFMSFFAAREDLTTGDFFSWVAVSPRCAVLAVAFVILGCQSPPVVVEMRRGEKIRLQREEFPEYGLAAMLPATAPDRNPGPASGAKPDGALYRNALIERRVGGLFGGNIAVSGITVEPYSAATLRAERLPVPAPGAVVVETRIVLDRQSDYLIVRSIVSAEQENRAALMRFSTDLTRDYFPTIRDRDLLVWQDEELFKKILRSVRVRAAGGSAWKQPRFITRPIQHVEIVAGGSAENVREYDPLDYNVLQVLQLHNLIYDKSPMEVRKPIGVLP